jgi:hypothetical protein
MIQYTRHNEIDKSKWDACISSSPESLIYNSSWYLDIMAAQWDALILKDYEAVMPLVWRKKFGITYLYQPFITAQLGICGPSVVPSLTDAFINAIPAHFKFIDIDLHENNSSIEHVRCCRKRINMLLDISEDYADINKGYHRLANRMIRRSSEEQLHVEPNANIHENIEFYKKHYNARVKIKLSDYENAEKMLEIASGKEQVLSLAAKQGERLLGMYILLKDQNYTYSLIGGSSQEGKEKGAFYLLTDHAIKTLSGTGRVFRFEGSDSHGIANFNHQFGAKPFYYNHLQLNRLPFLLRPFK